MNRIYTEAVLHPIHITAERTLMDTILFLLPAFFLVLGIVLFALGIRQQRKAKLAESWPTTPGVIHSCELRQHSSTDNDGMTTVTYEPVIQFSYRFMGVSYTGSQYRMGSRGVSFSRKKAETIASRYPDNSQVAVRYNPDNPAEAVLELGSASGPLLMIIGGVFAIVGPVLLVIFLTG
jgi:hypothetical protein